MNRKLLVVLLLLLCAGAVWRIVQVLNPTASVKVMATNESRLGAMMVKALGGKVGGLLVVCSDSLHPTPQFRERIKAVQDEAGKAGLSPQQIVVVERKVDPMDEQAGLPAVRFTDLFGELDQRAGFNGLLLMVEPGYPSSAEQAEIKRRGLQAVILSGNLPNARQLAASGLFNAVITPRLPGLSTSAPPAAADADEAAFHAAYELLRGPG